MYYKPYSTKNCRNGGNNNPYDFNKAHISKNLLSIFISFLQSLV
nr:MAG TPA: hypothetical protein [Caudoviricetes sp.]